MRFCICVIDNDTTIDLRNFKFIPIKWDFDGFGPVHQILPVTAILPMQLQIPYFPISDCSTVAELPDYMEIFLGDVEEKTGSFKPLLILEPHPESSFHGGIPRMSEAPEELVIMAFDAEFRAACFQALERVEEREPMFPSHPQKKSLKFELNIPIKALFRKMADMPITVFSLTLQEEGPEVLSIFFLQTPFTVSEFRREIALALSR